MGLLTFTGGATYLMLWPEDGKMRKEDIRAVFDGSIFDEILSRGGQEKLEGRGRMSMDKMDAAQVIDRFSESRLAR